jgi:O-antigen ligase
MNKLHSPTDKSDPNTATKTPNDAASGQRLSMLSELGPVLLVASCLVVLPFGRVVEIPVLLMAAIGLVLLVRNPKQWFANARVRLFAAIFLLAWLPILASWPDAISPESTQRIVLNHLRFFFAGIFVIYALRGQRQHTVFLRLCATVLIVWIIDAGIQWTIGTNMLGFELLVGRVNGFFGDRGLLLGISLMVFAGIVTEFVRRHAPVPLAATVTLALMTIVFISGSRASWIGLGVIITAYGGFVWYRLGRFPSGIACISAGVGAALIGTLYLSSASFAAHVHKTYDALTGTRAPVHNSVSHRFWIWDVAGKTYAANPVNGVGARGFRHAYDTYTSQDDPYLAITPPQRPTHTHQLWLEVLAETGTIGGLCLLALYALAIVTFVRADHESKQRMAPFGLCLLTAYFPLNTHLALYSAFWSQILWWLWAAFCAAAPLSARTWTPSREVQATTP